METPFQDTGSAAARAERRSLAPLKKCDLLLSAGYTFGVQVDKSGQKEWAERRGSGGKRWSVLIHPLGEGAGPTGLDSCDFWL